MKTAPLMEKTQEEKEMLQGVLFAYFYKRNEEGEVSFSGKAMVSRGCFSSRACYAARSPGSDTKRCPGQVSRGCLGTKAEGFKD